ncbi:MAG: ion transporter [Coriobacteriales bacterium]
MNDAPDGQTNSLKRWLLLALEYPADATRGGKVLCGIIYACIIGNAILVCVPDDWGSLAYDDFVFVFNLISAPVFTCEYIARIWISDKVRPKVTPVKARLSYMMSPMGIVDLLSFLPSWIMLFTPMSPALRDAISIIRLIRLFKISRYMRGLHTIGAVIRNRRQEIIAAFMVLGLLTVAASVLMYEAEHAAQPEAFDSILTGIYWAMTTITTTGYGDLVPITALGRVIGFVVMVLSIAIVAIPAGIFSAGFVEEFRNQRHKGLHIRRHADEDDGEDA